MLRCSTGHTLAGSGTVVHGQDEGVLVAVRGRAHGVSDQSLAGSGLAVFCSNGVVPMLSEPAPALVTSSSAPALVDVALAHHGAAREGRVELDVRGLSASSGIIGTLPARRSSRLSDDRTTMTWVSHTWLCSRVPVLTICPPGFRWLVT